MRLETKTYPTSNSGLYIYFRKLFGLLAKTLGHKTIKKEVEKNVDTDVRKFENSKVVGFARLS